MFKETSKGGGTGETSELELSGLPDIKAMEQNSCMSDKGIQMQLFTKFRTTVHELCPTLRLDVISLSADIILQASIYHKMCV